jgi:predicted small lipoprotein YifL
MKCLAHVTVLAIVSAELVGCGQKGPLVLPDAQPKHKRSLPLFSPAKPKQQGNAPAPAEASPATASPPPAPPPATPTPVPTPPTPGINGAAAAALTAPR